MTTETVPATSLVEDFSLYPRHDVNDTHVNELARAIASGAVLPPLIADRATRRLVDGFHRRRAFMRAQGNTTDVTVEFMDYPDEAALFLDAVRRNAGHGRRLDRQDQTRIVLRLQELQVESRVIAAALHVPEPEVQTLAVRIVYDAVGSALPQKRGLEHLRGTTLSASQVSAMKSVRSAEVGRICMELGRLLEEELVDYQDERVYGALKGLAPLIATALKKMKKIHSDREPVPA